MTTCCIEYNKDEAKLEVSGHSGYKEAGSDIVCAAISTACLVSANLIDKLNLGYNIQSIISEDGHFLLQVKTENETVKGIFDNLVETLDELHNQYPKYLKIRK